MYTYQMIGLADENEKTYECKYGTYSKDLGFKFNESINDVTDYVGWRGFINILFHDNLWKLQLEPVKEVTLEDIEREFGCKVRIVDPEPKKEELSKEQKEKIDKQIDFLNRWFGIDINPEDYY